MKIKISIRNYTGGEVEKMDKEEGEVENEWQM